MQELLRRYIEYARKVIKEISVPRMVGTRGEKEVAQVLERILTDAGISYRVEEFSGGTFHMRVLNRLFFPLIGCIMISIFFLNLYGFWIEAFILAIIGMCISLQLHNLIPWVLARTRNVGKVLKSKNFTFQTPIVESQSTSGIQKDVYFIAHWDSKSERLPIWCLFLITITGEYLNLLYCIHYILGTLIGFLIAPPNPWVFLWGAIVGVFSLSQLFNSMGNESPGALDDASGVGLCIALETYFQAFPPPCNVRVTFVLTGMEEFGDRGARAFLEKHRNEFSKDHTHFIVLDTIGDGNTVYHNKHGLFPVKEFDAEISLAIKNIIKDAPDRFSHIKHLYLPPSPVITDHLPFHQAGFKTLIIESSTFKTHSSRDVVEAIDPDQLRECMDLLICLVTFLGTNV